MFMLPAREKVRRVIDLYRKSRGVLVAIVDGMTQSVRSKVDVGWVNNA